MVVARLFGGGQCLAGEGAAQLIDHLKKPDMAREAERLLADTGWLPEPLRGFDPRPDADLGTNAVTIACRPF